MWSLSKLNDVAHRCFYLWITFTEADHCWVLIDVQQINWNITLSETKTFVSKCKETAVLQCWNYNRYKWCWISKDQKNFDYKTSLIKIDGFSSECRLVNTTFQFSRLVIIKNTYWAQNQHIRMISEGSCDTEDRSNGCWNSPLPTENSDFKMVVIFHNNTAFTVFMIKQMQAWWVEETSFKNVKILPTPNFWPVVYINKSMMNWCISPTCSSKLSMAVCTSSVRL